MKKYLLGLLAIVLAVGFSAFTVTKKFSEIYKITGTSSLSGTTVYLTDDAQEDVVSNCGTESEFCKITTANNITVRFDSSVGYYFIAEDGDLTEGSFQ